MHIAVNLETFPNLNSKMVAKLVGLWIMHISFEYKYLKGKTNKQTNQKSKLKPTQNTGTM